MEWNRTMRSIGSDFKTREAEGGKDLTIEGYFSVFGEVYEMGVGMSESIHPNAFDETLDGDIRALTDHDTRLVLGRTKANTLQLSIDSHGLYGRIAVNPNDSDAVNLYERVQRGDVDQASFGFDILSEDTDIHEDGSVHWTINKIKLYEISVVTFPAYESTAVSARAAERDEIIKRQMQLWRDQITERLEKAKRGE